MKLFEEYHLGTLKFKNRVVMSPMTRCRAIGNIPNDLMAEYYNQRSGAGLIITEGTSPSPNGLGYARIPGVYSHEQVQGWKKITDIVHKEGSKIFLQIMHTGRVSHPDNMEENAKIIAPSAIKLSGEMYTDTKGPQSYPQPKEMTLDEINEAQEEFVQAAKNAMRAGFDGVEIHGANGYLIEQFINPASNNREDEYGDSIENRSRFVLEVATKVIEAIGAESTGIRLSPYGVFNDMEIFDSVDETFEYIADQLGKMKLAYIHIVDHSSMGTPEVPESIKLKIKEAFNGPIIISGGLNKESAEKALNENKGDLAAFGRPFIANPDLVRRMKNDQELTEPDQDTFYSAGEEGYTDYPTFQNQ